MWLELCCRFLGVSTVPFCCDILTVSQCFHLFCFPEHNLPLANAAEFYLPLYPISSSVLCSLWLLEEESCPVYKHTYYLVFHHNKFSQVFPHPYAAVQLARHLIAIYHYIYCLFSQFCVTSKWDYFYCSLFSSYFSYSMKDEFVY